MIQPKKIITQIKDLQGFKSLITAYEEIASIRMKKTRDSVLYNRAYMNAIEEIFEEVRITYARQARALAKRRGRVPKLTFLAHNGKTVAVFLSANTGLYGEIIHRTYQEFTQEITAGNVEATIVGRYGLSLFINSFPDKPYTYFDLPDSDVQPADLAQIIRHIVQYEEIHIYYGKFLSVIKQEPTRWVVSAEISLDTEDGKAPKTSYLFEPSLEEILIFFETELFASLFDQSVNESQLAKYASRVISMNRADKNIDLTLKKLELEHLRINHHEFNKKQVNSLSSAVMASQ
jgi:ATP synthase F1 gamma subunit